MAAPDPPPGWITPTVPDPPPGYTTVEEPSFWARLQGTQPGPLIPSATPDQAGILPGRWTSAGGLQFDPYAGVLGSILRAVTTPGDVLSGGVPTPIQTGMPNPDLTSRATVTASIISPMSPAYRAGSRFGTVTPLSDDAWLASRRGNLTAPTPSTQAIADAADQGYTAVRQSGWQVPSTSVEDVARDATRMLTPNFTPGSAGTAPLTFGRLEQMTNQPYSMTSVPELMDHYDALTGIIKGGGSDAKAAYTARDQVAQMLSNLQAHGATPVPNVTPTMTPAEVNAILQDARGNTRAAMSANRISGDLNEARKGIIPEVEAGQGVSGMGYNLDRNLRARASKILADNANVASLLPDERAALEAVANGTATANALRNFGSIFGATNPLRALASVGIGEAGGAAVGLPGLGAGLAVGGTLAGSTASGMTRRALSATEELIRRNSPLAQSMLNTYSPGIGRDQAVMRALLPGLLAPPAPEQGRGLLVPPPPPGFI